MRQEINQKSDQCSSASIDNSTSIVDVRNLKLSFPEKY